MGETLWNPCIIEHRVTQTFFWFLFQTVLRLRSWIIQMALGMMATSGKETHCLRKISKGQAEKQTGEGGATLWNKRRQNKHMQKREWSQISLDCSRTDRTLELEGAGIHFSDPGTLPHVWKSSTSLGWERWLGNCSDRCRKLRDFQGWCPRFHLCVCVCVYLHKWSFICVYV